MVFDPQVVVTLPDCGTHPVPSALGSQQLPHSLAVATASPVATKSFILRDFEKNVTDIVGTLELDQ